MLANFIERLAAAPAYHRRDALAHLSAWLVVHCKLRHVLRGVEVLPQELP
ncbi:hypothetical protein QWY84_07960 [Aquisalimonas lutea]|nr:hypothetical protein [Aquisalimonas lutea]MDN3517539.1 hypothetical protein [Aquisalimonas lutea]